MRRRRKKKKRKKEEMVKEVEKWKRKEWDFRVRKEVVEQKEYGRGDSYRE